MKRKLHISIVLLFLLPICCYTNPYIPIGIKSLKDIGRHRINKIRGIQRDTMLHKLPFLTFHLGASAGFTEGTMQVDPIANGLTGTKIRLEDDLGFNKVKIFPRVNVYVRFGHNLFFIFDLFTIRRKETKTLERDIQFGNTLFTQGTRVESNFFLGSTILAYRYSFITRPRFDIGGILGGSGLYYRLKMEEDNETALSHKESAFLPVPVIGVDAMSFLNQNIYLRAVVKFSYSPIENYEYLIWSVRPYLEYYIWDNLGIGLKYHFSYNQIRDLSDDKFNGDFKYEFHAFSIVGTWRIM